MSNHKEIDHRPSVETFDDQEKEVLVNDGAVIYLPEGYTINIQRVREIGTYFWNVIHETPRLTDFPPRRIEVAIYPDPERLFISDSFNKNVAQQDRLIEQDTEYLRRKLRAEGLIMWRPEASEVTEVMYKHFRETGVNLLGADFMRRGGRYGPSVRTSTPTKFGRFAVVSGSFRKGDGPQILDSYPQESNNNLGVIRWIVPRTHNLH